MTVTLPVMSAVDAPFNQVPQHANVMAIIKALDDAVPWAVLREVVAQLQHREPDLCLQDVPINAIDAILLDIVTDLRALGLVTVGPSGSVLTAAADDTIRAWNGEFSRRLTALRAAIAAI